MYQGNSIPTTITALSQFDARLTPIARFIQREGHADIPLEHREDGQPIGYWCSNWRFRIETAIDTIPPEQIERLRQIGFLRDQPPPQLAVPAPAPVATMAELFSTLHKAQEQPAPEENFGIFETWLKPEKEPKQQETWTLPVGRLRSIHSDKPLPKVSVKKRRWGQVPTQ
ncbi:MAG: helicase associated domain-containing protein [Giesbergeria sp.]|uniref:helicase associated domain-containing protein n=1 Tax=Giesbergeria sp. TaxID=2818473 RepID=UPI00261C7A3E|nr:helicase associated domain-containing protein [Giesbergeria sp.]MDD2609360.1 helicase associated domain-containing protein [Giesbergeria sp.]